MKAVADTLHRVTLSLCIALFGVLFAGQIVVIVLRYVMGVGFLQLQDAVIYAFSCLTVLTIPLAMRLDRHVRVDVLREYQSPRARRLTDRLGHVVFILPVFALIAIDGWPLVSASWSIREGALETGGLPGLYIIKSVILVMSALVVLIAIADLVARGKDDGIGG